ncbi:MAG: carboxypeptidase regulatory-like domain-containing protein [bacterium]
MKTEVTLFKFLVLAFCLALTLPAASQAQGYKVKPVTNGGEISGTISFEGTPPAPREITVTKDKSVAKDRIRLVDVVAVKDGKLADAVVYLKKVVAGKAWPELAEGGMVDQRGARFILHSRVIHQGMKVAVKNSDPVMHNIHAYELIGRGRRTLFNKGQPKNMTFNLAFPVKQTPYVKIECDAHNFMHDYLFVADNPYYSVTAEDGKFSLTQVPPGRYTLVVWHPNLGTREAPVTVDAGERVPYNFTFTNYGGTK